MSLLISAFIIPIPTSALESGMNNGISGLISGFMGGFMGLWTYIRSRALVPDS